MSLKLGDTAPDFTQDSTAGSINFHEWAGDSWVLLFSHPKDFTPVCTTELGRIATLKPELDKRNVKAIGISVDSVEDHNGWVKDIADVEGTDVNFPILKGDDGKITELYDLVHPNADSTATARTVFVIDPAKKIRMTLTYPASAGRNWNEVLRVIDSIQLTENRQLTTPVDWKPGEDVIIAPSVSDADAKERFGEFNAVKPYLRYTAAPSK